MKNSENIKKQFDLIAEKYDEGRRCFIPCFDDYYNRSVSLLKNLKPSVNRIVDLGAGTGLLTMEMYLLYPEANFTLVDLSQDMLAIAKQRFNGLESFEYIAADYSAGIPANCDLICSALSIHHLENEQKQELYNAIYKALPFGGTFINLDQFCADSSVVNNAYNDWWMNFIDHSDITPEAKAKWIERKKLDREVSIPTTMNMLKNAGFDHVECIYQFMKFGTVIAVK